MLKLKFAPEEAATYLNESLKESIADVFRQQYPGMTETDIHGRTERAFRECPHYGTSNLFGSMNLSETDSSTGFKSQNLQPQGPAGNLYGFYNKSGDFFAWLQFQNQKEADAHVAKFLPGGKAVLRKVPTDKVVPVAVYAGDPAQPKTESRRPATPPGVTELREAKRTWVDEAKHEKEVMETFMQLGLTEQQARVAAQRKY